MGGAVDGTVGGAAGGAVVGAVGGTMGGWCGGYLLVLLHLGHDTLVLFGDVGGLRGHHVPDQRDALKTCIYHAIGLQRANAPQEKKKEEKKRAKKKEEQQSSVTRTARVGVA